MNRGRRRLFAALGATAVAAPVAVLAPRVAEAKPLADDAEMLSKMADEIGRIAIMHREGGRFEGYHQARQDMLERILNEIGKPRLPYGEQVTIESMQEIVNHRLREIIQRAL